MYLDRPRLLGLRLDLLGVVVGSRFGTSSRMGNTDSRQWRGQEGRQEGSEQGRAGPATLSVVLPSDLPCALPVVARWPNGISVSCVFSSLLFILDHVRSP